MKKTSWNKFWSLIGAAWLYIKGTELHKKVPNINYTEIISPRAFTGFLELCRHKKRPIIHWKTRQRGRLWQGKRRSNWFFLFFLIVMPHNFERSEGLICHKASSSVSIQRQQTHQHLTPTKLSTAPSSHNSHNSWIKFCSILNREHLESILSLNFQ